MYILGENMRISEYEIDKVDKEAVVFLPSYNKVVVLNQSALGIFTIIQKFAQSCENITENLIYDKLMNEYNYIGVDKSEVVADIKKVIDSFRSSGLIEADE